VIQRNKHPGINPNTAFYMYVLHSFTVFYNMLQPRMYGKL